MCVKIKVVLSTRNSYFRQELDSLCSWSVLSVNFKLETVDVHNEEEEAAPLHVLEKLVTHPEVVARPLNEPRQIC